MPFGHGYLGNLRFDGDARVVYGPSSRAAALSPYLPDRASARLLRLTLMKGPPGNIPAARRAQNPFENKKDRRSPGVAQTICDLSGVES